MMGAHKREQQDIPTYIDGSSKEFVVHKASFTLYFRESHFGLACFRPASATSSKITKTKMRTRRARTHAARHFLISFDTAGVASLNRDRYDKCLDQRCGLISV